MSDKSFFDEETVDKIREHDKEQIALNKKKGQEMKYVKAFVWPFIAFIIYLLVQVVAALPMQPYLLGLPVNEATALIVIPRQDHLREQARLTS